MTTIAALLAVPGVASAGQPDIAAPSTPVTQLTATSARLTAIVKSELAPSSFHVEIGRTRDYGFKTAEHVNPFPVSVQAWVTIFGMAPSTTYHFRFVATNAAGTRYGEDLAFTTPAGEGVTATELLTETAPVDPTPVPMPSDDSATPPADPLATGDLVPPLTPSTPAAPQPADESGAAPVLLPEADQTVVAGPVMGAVSVRTPGATAFTSLSSAAQIPLGTVVDARRGALEISADTGAKVDTGRFWGAVFTVTQPAGAGGRAELTLVGGRPSRCPSARRARAAGAKDVRGLWGKDRNGRFRTRGRNSVATVRGTVWYVAERCAGTLTRVIRGAVSVRDTRTGRTTLVTAGHHLMVRDAARAASRRR